MMIRASEPPMKLRLFAESGSIRGVIAYSPNGSVYVTEISTML
jgi:hypothetical protein